MTGLLSLVNGDARRIHFSTALSDKTLCGLTLVVNNPPEYEWTLSPDWKRVNCKRCRAGVREMQKRNRKARARTDRAQLAMPG